MRPQAARSGVAPQSRAWAVAKHGCALHPPRMHPDLRAIASTQAGLFTRAQALGVGYRERELRTHTAVHGPWVVVRRGVYVERGVWEERDEYDGAARLRDRAVHLSMRTQHLMSHDSAARALGIPLLRTAPELAHVTREGVMGTRTERGVKHHLTRLPQLACEVVDGLPLTTAARTAVDVAREHGLHQGVIACDHVLNRGFHRAALENELLTMWCWPHVTVAKAAVELADAGAESIGESLTRLLVRELGIGVVHTQFPVRTRSGVAWIDMRVGCHLVEFDGRLKFRGTGHGGVATRNVEDVVWDERRRQAEVCAEGLGMSRVTWDQLFGVERERTKARIAREFAVTLARFGHELPPRLAEFEARMRGRRRRTG